MTSIDAGARQRTEAFARVIGPYVAVFAGTYAIRLPDLNGLISGLFDDSITVLLLGAMMLAAGLIIISLHRSWRGPVAVVISLFGWFVAIRGFLLIATPAGIHSGVAAIMASPPAVVLARVFFAALAAVGLLLTYWGWIRPRRQTRT